MCVCVCRDRAENCWLLSSTKANSRKQKPAAGRHRKWGGIAYFRICATLQRSIICTANNAAGWLAAWLEGWQADWQCVCVCVLRERVLLCGSHNLLFKHAKCCMQHAKAKAERQKQKQKHPTSHIKGSCSVVANYKTPLFCPATSSSCVCVLRQP